MADEGWTDAQRRGFALAAAVCEDRGARRARAGLSTAATRAAPEHAETLIGLDRDARRRWLKAALAPHPTLASEQGRRPARALSLLASQAPRALGARWLSGAPLPRPGYRPPPDLLALLRRVATQPASGGQAEGEAP
ncbi:MAG: hypothetical protein PVI30_07295 [Myxococcales bacterium]